MSRPLRVHLLPFLFNPADLREGVAVVRFVPADDSTYLAMNLYETRGRDYDRVLETMRLSQGGRNLIECSLESDIAWCAEQDRFKLVPELDHDRWEIRVINEAQPQISSPP